MMGVLPAGTTFAGFRTRLFAPRILGIIHDLGAARISPRVGKLVGLRGHAYSPSAASWGPGYALESKGTRA